MLKELAKKRVSKISIERTIITPTLAKAWLDTNGVNRRINKRHLAQYARDIDQKNWVLTAECVKFDRNGLLIDGQHRLTACVETGKPFETYVAYGLDPAAKNVIDTGKGRSGADVLAMRGLKNTVAIAAALRLLINERSAVQHRMPVTHTELLEAYHHHLEIDLWVPLPGTLPRGISAPLVGYVAYVGGHILGKKSRALAMINVLKTGEPDYAGDPIHKFRERLIRMRDSDVGTLRGRDDTCWTLKSCWNSFAQRKSIERLTWQTENVDIAGLDKNDL